MIRGKRYSLKEKSRIYTFVGGRVELEDVEEIIVSSSNNHKLKTADKKKHIIPPIWIHIEIDRVEDWIS